MQPAPQQQPAKKSMSTTTIVLIVAGVLVFGLIMFGGILVVLGIYGAKKYMTEAKRVEGRMNVAVMAQGMVACAARPAAKGVNGLPPSSHKVPAAIASISGKKYQSMSSEWSSDPAFTCAMFEIASPQYFQYDWQRDSALHGTARAVADLDGDGVIDATAECVVTCTAPGECTAGVPTVK